MQRCARSGDGGRVRVLSRRRSFGARLQQSPSALPPLLLHDDTAACATPLLARRAAPRALPLALAAPLLRYQTRCARRRGGSAARPGGPCRRRGRATTTPARASMRRVRRHITGLWMSRGMQRVPLVRLPRRSSAEGAAGGRWCAAEHARWRGGSRAGSWRLCLAERGARHALHAGATPGSRRAACGEEEASRESR